MLAAVLKYRQIMESELETILYVPIIDVRTDDEKLKHRRVQEFGHRLVSNIGTNKLNIILVNFIYKSF